MSLLCAFELYEDIMSFFTTEAPQCPQLFLWDSCSLKERISKSNFRSRIALTVKNFFLLSILLVNGHRTGSNQMTVH